LLAVALSRLSRWCYHHRKRVVLLWIAAFIVLNGLGAAIGNAYSNNFSGGHSDSVSAYNLLKTRFPARAGDTADIVFSSPSGVRSPQVETAMQSLFNRVGPGRVAHVDAIDSPYTQPGRISANGTIAYATVTFDKQAGDMPTKTAQPLIDAAKAVKVPGLRIALDGPVVALATQSPPSGSEAIGIFAAMIILFLAFGSLIAMSLPIIAAIAGVGIGSVFVALLSHIITVPSFAPYVAIMIGLGVGIDYALFIVVRYRSGLHDGLDPEAANITALATAGRAVLFAGSTVIVSLFGMFMMGVSFIYGLSVGAILAVLMTMAASVTLVPAIIGFAGTKLATKEHKRRQTGETFAFRWSRRVQRHPWLMGGGAVVLLVTLAIPLFSIRLGVADQGNDPSSTTTRQAYDLLAQGFGPGFNGPVLLAADLTGSTTLTAVENLAANVRHDSDVAFVAPVRPNPADNAALVTVIPRGAPQDRSTSTLVHRLRQQIKSAGLVVHVGGETAIGIDAANQVGARLPYMFVTVLLLSFLLLMTAFRSVVIAIKAGIMNLLSIGASYGVIVAIFQWGWLRNVVGIGRPGPIEFWVPMMLFTILFGLSMDYEVFLLSRIREEYVLTGDTNSSVANGVALSARVITAAAAIMAAVFLSFVLSDQRVLKLMGLGLATAVIIDATLVRMVLVPAVMQLLGRANWWIPGWIDRRLPRLTIDHAPEAVPSPPSAAEPAAV
jgi:RND superfamily putative drug exporter